MENSIGAYAYFLSKIGHYKFNIKTRARQKKRAKRKSKSQRRARKNNRK